MCMIPMTSQFPTVELPGSFSYLHSRLRANSSPSNGHVKITFLQ